MSLSFSDLTSRLFRRFTRKPSVMTNRFRPTVTALEDRVNPIATTVSVSVLTHATEGTSSGSFRVTQVGTMSVPVTVNFAISGTATSGTDFSSMGTWVTLPANCAYADIFVDTLPDNLVEGTETVVFTVTSGTGYTTTGSPATVNITDSPVVIAMTAGNATENGSAGGFTFTRTGGAPAQALAFEYTLGGTAIADTDYIAPPRGLSFAANESSVGMTVDPLNDDDVEGTETVSVTLAASPNYTIGTTTTTANVSDDDTASLPETPVVSVVPGGDAVRGGAVAGWFLVARFGNLAAPLTVNLSVGGTATPGTDYTALPSTVTFPANESTVSVPVNAPNGTPLGSTVDVSLAVASGTGYTVSTTSNTAIIIVYDPPPPGGPPPVPGSGGGLFARYYNTKDLYDLKTTRIDDNIDFTNWGQNAPPGTGVGADHFSVSWVGRVQAPIMANYFFHTISDDGIRVWIEVDEFHPPTIDDWTIHAPNPVPTSSVGFALAAGQMVNIRVEYFENTLGASVQLLWSNNVNPAKVVIPKLQLYPVAFDLDVDKNSSIRDAIDGANDYLPGYEGNIQMVSAGDTFNTDTYTGQRMKLVLDGVGTSTTAITKVEFVMEHVSKLGGYASNSKDNTAVGTATTDEDYSFHKKENYRNANQENKYTITPTSNEQELPNNGGLAGGKMETGKTWVNFYAKDYGAFARLEARIWVQDGAGERMDFGIRLRVPRDTDTIVGTYIDGFADKWEIQMGKRWTTQYGLPAFTVPQALENVSYLRDHEDPDPDRVPNTRLVPQADTGDAHTILEEYRGYILDDGGFDGAGENGHRGGHIRLDPARKEILVEVDRAAVLNNLPGAGNDTDAKLMGILNGASKVFSNATRGTGVYMYWLMDQTTLTLPKVVVDAVAEQIFELGDKRNAQLQSDFLHLLFINEGDPNVIGSAARAYIKDADPLLPVTSIQSGVVFSTTDLDTQPDTLAYPKREELFGTAVAHELTHLLYQKFDGEFNIQGHTTNPDKGDPPLSPLDRPCLMLHGNTRQNREYATVKFFDVVQVELKTATTKALVL